MMITLVVVLGVALVMTHFLWLDDIKPKNSLNTSVNSKP